MLALFPTDAQVFVSLDFRRIKTTDLWMKVEAQINETGGDDQDRRIVNDFTRATGIDPFKNIHRVLAAFPEEARRSQAFGVVLEGDKVDRARLFAHLRSEAKSEGGEVVESKRGPYTLWSSSKPGQASGFFFDDTHFVIGSGGWTEIMADRAAGVAQVAKDGGKTGAAPALQRLIERAGKGRSIWLAAMVPEATRAELMKNPRFGAEASVMRFGGGLDLGPDLAGDFVAELASADDAKAMTAKVDTFLAAAKKSPEVLLLGVAPYLDAIKAEAEGPNARVRVNLPKAQAEELTARAIGLLRMKRPAKAE